MTKCEADKMLQEKMAELSDRAQKADNKECIELVDSMLKVYAVLAGSDGFDNEFGNTISPNIGS